MKTTAVAGVFFFLFGLILGSFLNVCIYRLPRGESLLWPRSHCPTCGRTLRAGELVPLLSFFWLRGRCRGCGARISGRYPLVELLAGLLSLALYYRYGFTPAFAVYLALAFLLLVAAAIDLEWLLIPDLVTIPGLVLGLAVSLRPDFGFPAACWGVLVGGVPLYLVHCFYPQGLGGGDAKLMAMVGAFLGWRGALGTLFFGSFAGSVITLALIALRRRTRKEPIPFGPFLAAGALVWLFWGERLVGLLFH